MVEGYVVVFLESSLNPSFYNWIAYPSLSRDLLGFSEPIAPEVSR